MTLQNPSRTLLLAVQIEYAVLPNGAQITFETKDIQLITALHQWFGAQLSDHGQDAMTT